MSDGCGRSAGRSQALRGQKTPRLVGGGILAQLGEQGGHVGAEPEQGLAHRRGRRRNRRGEGPDPNQIMRNMAAALSEEEIDAVASYVQGLR